MKVTDFLEAVADTREKRLILGVIVVLCASLMAECVVSLSGDGRLHGSLIAVVTGVIFLGLVWIMLRLPQVQRFVLTGSWGKGE
jgi:hypothetical protein